MKSKLLILGALALLSTLNPQLSASPLGTAFTYQGQLTDGGRPAEGIYDFRFAIYAGVAEAGASRFLGGRASRSRQPLWKQTLWLLNITLRGLRG